MADLDPLSITREEIHTGDGERRRANERVTRNYMQFGN